MWSGARAGTKNKKEVYGVGFAIHQAVWDGLEEGDRVVEGTSPGPMKVVLECISLQLGESSFFFLSGYAPTANGETIAKDLF